MSNRTYVCVECRTVKRAEAAYGLITNYRCPSCKRALSELDWKRRVPAKTDSKGWKELQCLIIESEKEWSPRRSLLGINKISKIDKKISALKAQSNVKAPEIKKLKFNRQVVARKHNLA